MSHGKKYNEARTKVDNKKLYPIAEAIKLIKSTSTTKFDSSVEIHVHLGIDAKKGEQQVRGTISMPHGTGKTKRVAVFVTDPAKEEEARAAGADVVGGEDLIAKIVSSGKVDFDVAVATPDMMSKMAKAAKILGPKGLMPSPKNETVTPNIKKAVEELKKGKIAFKNDDTANLHQIIGKASFTEQQLTENFTSLMEAIRKAKPSTSKGVYIIAVTLATTMGPGVKIQL